VAVAEQTIKSSRAEAVDCGDIVVDPVISARMAGLRHVDDRGPGIRRKRAGKHFSYIGVDGAPIHDPNELKRIKSLAIPPAWTDVWISPSARGHIQATGRDARGRKQYRYHPRWREIRDDTKYHRMIAFGQALPRIRERINHDLALRGLPREKVLATVVRLLEGTLIRVGNEEYARENRSYGLTTMRNRHVDVEGSTLRFHFKGKSGVKHDVGIRDRRVASIVKRLRELPGQHLFQYVDDDSTQQEVTSEDVNAYLYEITGEHFTAKDFRTWAGTLLAATALQEFESFDSETQAKKNIVQAIESVSQRLGNTPSVCRKCYIHPEIINAYLEGSTLHTVRELVEQEMSESLGDVASEEAAVMALLRQRLARDEEARKAS
jgi:DNA topoisomerase-1